MTPRGSPAKAPFEPLFFERDPLFWPISGVARAFSEYIEWPPVADYDPRISEAAAGGLVRSAPRVAFREQPPKPRRRRRTDTSARELYDGRIVEEGWVPTRPGSWHDFLNMLVWAVFPEAKQQLHARQHRAISARLGPTLPNARTREQDALALLDEGGVLIACRSAALERAREALRERREDEALRLFAEREARAVVFGHAIFEGLVLGREDGWAAAWFVAHDGDLGDGAALVGALDSALAKALAEQGTFRSPADLSRADLHLIRPR
jgi:hypothetical protein